MIAMAYIPPSFPLDSDHIYLLATTIAWAVLSSVICYCMFKKHAALTGPFIFVCSFFVASSFYLINDIYELCKVLFQVPDTQGVTMLMLKCILGVFLFFVVAFLFVWKGDDKPFASALKMAIVMFFAFVSMAARPFPVCVVVLFALVVFATADSIWYQVRRGKRR